MPSAEARSTSVPWAVVCGLGALLVLIVPVSVTALLMAAGWQGCLLDCTEASNVLPGLFWGSLGLLLFLVATGVVWVLVGYHRFPRRLTITAVVMLLVGLIVFVLI
ncbi:hypothetical protein [Naumannella halotolerans]|uniref:hypothetical protein n=1 Tax=Naumannella halotolerans TaxID=993414 RepID=UPI001060A5A9|nr:hypothetical protein [Naumannella halotolerans]